MWLSDQKKKNGLKRIFKCLIFVSQIFGPALTGLSAKIRGENILGEYRPALRVSRA